LDADGQLNELTISRKPADVVELVDTPS
jgi:hypothetical protein